MTLNAELKKQLIDSVKTLVPNLRCIYLFGSFHSNQATEKSDIDIAILADYKLLPVARWEIQSELATILNREVDLVDLLSASTVMQFQVIKEGSCLYDLGNSAARFEMQVMSMYQHLNLERADILNEVMGH